MASTGDGFVHESGKLEPSIHLRGSKTTTGQTRRPRGGTTVAIAPSESADATNVTDAIARRAFELFLERGAVHGHHLDDWLAAERQLSATPIRKRRAAPRTLRAGS